LLVFERGEKLAEGVYEPEQRESQSRKEMSMDRTEHMENKAKVLSDKTSGPQNESCCGIEKKTEGCLICGKELIYSPKPSQEICFICGKEYESNMRCINGHFICDQCHSAGILQQMESLLMGSTEVNPLNLIQRVFDLPGLNMHGPEYHSIVPAVLVTAYQNMTGKKDLVKIKESIKRGTYIKGGGCGYYGTCGACVGAGIAVSVIDDVTPMSVDKRALANTVTGLALLEISKHGGPRCCKREAVTAIKTFMRNTAYFQTVPDVNFICKQYKINKDCIGEKCLYYPQP